MQRKSSTRKHGQHLVQQITHKFCQRLNNKKSTNQIYYNNNNNNIKKLHFRIRNRKGGDLKGYVTPPCHNSSSGFRILKLGGWG